MSDMIHPKAADLAAPVETDDLFEELDRLPFAVARTLDGFHGLSPECFGEQARRILPAVDSVLILACGGSYHLALLAKGWIESLAALPVSVEFASEFRYRDSVAKPRSLVVALSRSGDTADLLGAIELAERMGMPNTLAICNAALARACALAFTPPTAIEGRMTPARTCATELIALFVLTLVLARTRRALAAQDERRHLQALRALPDAIDEVLALKPRIRIWAERLAPRDNMVFLGRGMHYPVAVEGALSMKEIACVHAEAFPAGELKHGPLALVSADMPVVVTAPHDRLLEKLNSNLQEVGARNGQLFVFADADCSMPANVNLDLIRLGQHRGLLTPVLHIIPMQLLARHAALARGSGIGRGRDSAWTTAADAFVIDTREPNCPLPTMPTRMPGPPSPR